MLKNIHFQIVRHFQGRNSFLQMKHQIRDAQQKLAKIMALDQLPPETGF